MSSLLGKKHDMEPEYTDFDIIRSENQNKTIIELKKEIEEYKKRERAFITHLHLKEKHIFMLESKLKANNNKNLQGSCFVDTLQLNEFNKLKQLIKEKDEKILQKEEELSTLQPTQNNPNFKKLLSKSKDLYKENMEFYNYSQSGTLENLKYENGIKDSQIDQLMLKLKEKECVVYEQEIEINELSEILSILNKRVKDIEEELLISKQRK